MDIDSIRPVLSGLIGGAVALLLQRLTRRARPQNVAAGTLLRYSRGLLILAFAAFMIFSAFTVYNVMGDGSDVLPAFLKANGIDLE